LTSINKINIKFISENKHDENTPLMLPQLEQIKTELKQRNYEENKTVGTYLRLTIDIRG
jgi:hypothetical protein